MLVSLPRVTLVLLAALVVQGRMLNTRGAGGSGGQDSTLDPSGGTLDATAGVDGSNLPPAKVGTLDKTAGVDGSNLVPPAGGQSNTAHTNHRIRWACLKVAGNKENEAAWLDCVKKKRKAAQKTVLTSTQEAKLKTWWSENKDKEGPPHAGGSATKPLNSRAMGLNRRAPGGNGQPQGQSGHTDPASNTPAGTPSHNDQASRHVLKVYAYCALHHDWHVITTCIEEHHVSVPTQQEFNTAVGGSSGSGTNQPNSGTGGQHRRRALSRRASKLHRRSTHLASGADVSAAFAG